MNTATATATEYAFTTHEALSALAADGDSIVWKVIEEFRISLDCLHDGDRWFAGLNHGARPFELGATPREAVEKLLRNMGGTE